MDKTLYKIPHGLLKAAQLAAEVICDQKLMHALRELEEIREPYAPARRRVVVNIPAEFSDEPPIPAKEGFLIQFFPIENGLFALVEADDGKVFVESALHVTFKKETQK